ncbi:hypothetical protein TrCOL_g3235 [Triparma columacea]|uniref:Uncharacterized protein n=1 Tax=Triparma columacea TaxID=722753 RepID=A0A9W7G5M8_9STRA|nr:hypothetical protein TrCOL_g3235 [Triparma columacea]
MLLSPITICLFIALIGVVVSFTPPVNPSRPSTRLYEYIPSGLTKAQWEKQKAKEAAKTKGKNLGKVGVTSFKSRSFAEWQKSGGKNLFPVDPTKVKNAKDIPYMQRGGAPDDSDLKKPNFFDKLFKKPEKKMEEPPPPPKKNPWTF